MRVLADEYAGAVQFAIVDAMKHKDLEMMFGAQTLPLTLFYKDGIWYEQHMFQILVNNIRTFIDSRHLEQ